MPKDKLARRFWALISWNAGINPTTDGVPTTFEGGEPGLRALCKTLAAIAVEELEDAKGRSQ